MAVLKRLSWLLLLALVICSATVRAQSDAPPIQQNSPFGGYTSFNQALRRDVARTEKHLRWSRFWRVEPDEDAVETAAEVSGRPLRLFSRGMVECLDEQGILAPLRQGKQGSYFLTVGSVEWALTGALGLAGIGSATGSALALGGVWGDVPGGGPSTDGVLLGLGSVAFGVATYLMYGLAENDITTYRQMRRELVEFCVTAMSDPDER